LWKCSKFRLNQNPIQVAGALANAFREKGIVEIKQ
jgi:stage V sporulation protein SpoVS